MTRAAPTRSVRTVRIGTAAWGNPPAERHHRDPKLSHLKHYASLFNAVEINSSFYRSHRRGTYERWRDSVPAGFRFSVKLPRSITHERALRRCRTELSTFIEEVSGLGTKLGVVLVQTPGSLAFEAPVASRFLTALVAATSCPIALEPRHPSWFTSRAEDLLRRWEVARVAADPARVPQAAEPGGWGNLVYYRLHGSPRMYYSAYAPEFLRNLSMRIGSVRRKSTEVWCIFDNTAMHASWANARLLQSFLA